MIEKNQTKEYKEKDIIDEIHEGRATLLEKFNGDLRALFDDARRRDKESGRVIVNREHSSSPEVDRRSEAS